MLKLAKVEIRCREHESFEPTCEHCRVLIQADQELLSLRTRRDTVFRKLKDCLSKRDLIIIDLG